MLVSCWSVKGGSGTTVVSLALAAVLARSGPARLGASSAGAAAGSLLVDLGGDVPTALGIPEPSGPALVDWLAADGAPVDALTRLEVEVAGGVRLLPRGQGPMPDAPERFELLAGLLAADGRPVVADCGLVPGPGLPLAAGASVSLLVVRPCYLALRRALAAPVRPSGVVLVREVQRALGSADVEAVRGVPVRAVVAVAPAGARAVDAGLLLSRLPRRLERSLRRAA